MSRIPSFKDLEVWRKAIKLVRRIYEISRAYPTEERFGLCAETRKSARSLGESAFQSAKHPSDFFDLAFQTSERGGIHVLQLTRDQNLRLQLAQ